MKTLLLTSLLALAGSISASANTVTFNCTPFPATFQNGAGSSSVACPSLNSGGATGATVLNSVTTTYYATYQFGGLTGTNSISVTYTPSTLGGTVSWNLPTTTVTNTGTGSTVITSGSGSAASGVSLANFGASGFNVALVSSVTGGTVATSSGAASVTYDYSIVSSSTPEPATISLIGASLVGLGFLSRRRKA